MYMVQLNNLFFISKRTERNEYDIKGVLYAVIMSRMELLPFLAVLSTTTRKAKDDVCLVKNFGAFETGVTARNYFLAKFTEIPQNC